MKIRDRIIKCLENVGILIDENYSDLNINDYNVDSITFISFIVEIEKEFDIIIPDGFLYSDLLSSLNGFTNLVETLVNDSKKK